MKVLFVGNHQRTFGGEAMFQSTLLAGLQRLKTSHQLFYVENVPGSAVQLSVVANQIDFVWFMFPCCEPVEVPFAVTVWDFGHRDMPCFPEVSISGVTFEHRETFYRSTLPRAAMVVIGNNEGARKVSAYYQVPPANICTIPIPVDLDAIRGATKNSALIEQFGLTPGKFLFYPAQFWPHKNHITLIDILRKVRDRGCDFKLVLSGVDFGNRSHVENYITQCDLREQVVLAGYVDTPVLHQFYLNAFALVYASLMGPDNLPPIEAMGYGCPVVCATYDGAREQLGDAALYFDGLDPDEAAEQVLRLTDPVLKEQLIAKGNALVQTYSKEEYIKKIGDALDRFAKVRRLWGPCNSYRHP